MAGGEARDAGTMTPPVRFVVVKPEEEEERLRRAQRPESSRVSAKGVFLPGPELVLVTAPLVRLREPTEEEWEVEDVLEGLVSWCVDDNHKRLARAARQRFNESGQNVVHNMKVQQRLAAQRKAALEAHRKSVEEEARLCITRAKKAPHTTAISLGEGLEGLLEAETNYQRNIASPMAQVEENAKLALRRSIRAGQLKAAREAAKMEEQAQQLAAEREAERLKLRAKEAMDIVGSVLHGCIRRAVRIAEGRSGRGTTARRVGQLDWQSKKAMVKQLYSSPAPRVEWHPARHPKPTNVSIARHLRQSRRSRDDVPEQEEEEEEEEEYFDPEELARQQRLQSTGGWDTTPNVERRPGEARRDSTLLLDQRPPPTVPRKPPPRKPLTGTDRPRAVSARVSSSPGRRPPGGQRAVSARVPRASNKFSSAESAEATAPAVPAAGRQPVPLEGPWTDGAEGSTEGGETDLVAMMRATMGEIEAERAEVDEVRRRQQVSVKKRPETYDEAYEVDLDVEVATRRRNAVLSASPAVWGAQPGPPPPPPLPHFEDLSYRPLWKGSHPASPSWWAALLQLLTAQDPRCVLHLSTPDIVLVQDGYLTGWYQEDPTLGLLAVPMLHTLRERVMKRFLSLHHKTKALVREKFKVTTGTRGGSARRARVPDGDGASAEVNGRRCRVPIALAHYWNSETETAKVLPLTVKQLRGVLENSYSASEQMLHQPGIGDTKEDLPFLIRSFTAFDPQRRTRYLTQLKLRESERGGGKAVFVASGFGWREASTAVEAAAEEEAAHVAAAAAAAEEEEEAPVEDVEAEGPTRFSPPEGPPPLRPLVDEEDEDGVVDDVLWELLVDAEAFATGLEALPEAVTDVLFPPAPAPPRPVSRPLRGGHRVPGPVRRELFEVTKRVVEFMLQVHGLSCAGVSAEWIRCVDGSLRLAAIHSMDWHADSSPHDLARVASSLSLALPAGTRGLPREQAAGGTEPGGGVKPGWNTHTTKMTTFQAGSPFRPDRAEPPPPTVHPPSENPESKREKQRAMKVQERKESPQRRPAAIRQAMEILEVADRDAIGRGRREAASPTRRHEQDLDLLLEESSTFSGRQDASWRIPYADLSQLDEELSSSLVALASAKAQESRYLAARTPQHHSRSHLETHGRDPDAFLLHDGIDEEAAEQCEDWFEMSPQVWAEQQRRDYVSQSVSSPGGSSRRHHQQQPRGSPPRSAAAYSPPRWRGDEGRGPPPPLPHGPLYGHVTPSAYERPISRQMMSRRQRPEAQPEEEEEEEVPFDRLCGGPGGWLYMASQARQSSSVTQQRQQQGRSPVGSSSRVPSNWYSHGGRGTPEAGNQRASPSAMGARQQHQSMVSSPNKPPRFQSPLRGGKDRAMWGGGGGSPAGRPAVTDPPKATTPRVNSAPVRRAAPKVDTNNKPRRPSVPVTVRPTSAVDRLHARLDIMEEALQAGTERAAELAGIRNEPRTGGVRPRQASIAPIVAASPPPPEEAPYSGASRPSGAASSQHEYLLEGEEYSSSDGEEQQRGGVGGQHRQTLRPAPSSSRARPPPAGPLEDSRMQLNIAMTPSPGVGTGALRGGGSARGRDLPIELPLASQALGYKYSAPALN